jgi:ornithine--oxo-acid transaminase
MAAKATALHMLSRKGWSRTRFLDGLRGVRSNTIREVRWRGLMLAVELHPEAGDARRYCEALPGRVILAEDTHGHTIRIAPLLGDNQRSDRLGVGGDRSHSEA